MSGTMDADALRRSRGIRQSNGMSESTRQSSLRNRSSAGNGQSGLRALQQPRQMKKMATGLGWFSIGLGLAELLAPDSVARIAGVRPTNTVRTILRVSGAREITHGIGILTSDRSPGWVWSRVAGDVLDLSMVGTAMTKDENDRGRL